VIYAQIVPASRSSHVIPNAQVVPASNSCLQAASDLKLANNNNNNNNNNNSSRKNKFLNSGSQTTFIDREFRALAITKDSKCER
jgi:hypothetical protein